MYAVVRSGGKQYRVSRGDVIQVEHLDGEVGATLTLDQVLLLGGNGETKIGKPLVAQGKVKAEILKQGLAKKIVVFKKKRRKGYTRKHGHRQQLTTLRIVDIQG